MSTTISGTNGVTFPDSTSMQTGQQACKAWVNFNGTGTVAIRGEYNVSSITDNGTGDYTVNFTTAMPNINFCSQGFSWASGKNATPIILGAKASTTPPHTTSSVRVTVHDNFAESVLYDADYVCVAVFSN